MEKAFSGQLRVRLFHSAARDTEVTGQRSCGGNSVTWTQPTVAYRGSDAVLERGTTAAPRA
jgi:hypothetical protein